MSKILDVIKPNPTDIYVMGVDIPERKATLSDGQTIYIQAIKKTIPKKEFFTCMAGPDNRGRWWAFKVLETEKEADVKSQG